MKTVMWIMVGDDSISPFKEFVDGFISSHPGVSDDGLNRLYSRDFTEEYVGDDLIIVDIPYFVPDSHDVFDEEGAFIETVTYDGLSKLNAIRLMAMELLKPSVEDGFQRVIRAPRGVIKSLHATAHWRIWSANYEDSDYGRQSFMDDKITLGMPESLSHQAAHDALLTLLTGDQE